MRPGDGEPRVFAHIADTEVPALKSYLQLAAAAYDRRAQGATDDAPTRRVGAVLLECLEASKRAHDASESAAGTASATGPSNASSTHSESSETAAKAPGGKAAAAVSASSAAEKKPPSGYMLFCKVERPKITATNPSLPFGEVGKMLGAAWAKASAAVKISWNRGVIPASSASTNVAAPVAPAAPAAPAVEPPAFVADYFDGVRPGYTFTSGPQGIGYYRAGSTTSAPTLAPAPTTAPASDSDEE